MAKTNEGQVAVARVYARSIMDLATQRGEVERVLDELQQLAGYVAAHPDFAAFLTSPGVDVEARRSSIDKLFRGKLSDVLVDALQVLNRKSRLAIVEALAETFRVLWQETNQRVDVRVTTAVPLTEEFRESLRQTVKKRMGKTAELVESVDESIVAGIVFHVGDHKYDGSVAFALDKLGRALLDRAAAEIHSSQRTYVTG